MSCPCSGEAPLRGAEGRQRWRGGEGAGEKPQPGTPSHRPSPAPLVWPRPIPLVAARFHAPPLPPLAAASSKSRESRAVRRARAAPCRMPLGAAGAPPRPAAPAPRTEPGSASRQRSAPGPCPCSSLRSPRPPGHAPLPLPFLRRSGGPPAAGPGAEPGGGNAAAGAAAAAGAEPPAQYGEGGRWSGRGAGGEPGGEQGHPPSEGRWGRLGWHPPVPHPAGLWVSPPLRVGAGCSRAGGHRRAAPGSRGCPALRGPGCGDGRRLVLILAPVLLPHSHAPSRENFGLCFWSPLRSEAGGLPGDPVRVFPQQRLWCLLGQWCCSWCVKIN